MAVHPEGSGNGKRSRNTGDPPKPMEVSVRGRDSFNHMSVAKRTEAKFPHYQTVRKFLTHSTSFLFSFVYFSEAREERPMIISSPNQGKEGSSNIKSVLKF